MRLALIGTVVVALGFVSAARAQPGAAGPSSPYPVSPFPGVPMINPANVMPNIFNPRTQPLSPYLNLFSRTGDPAVNYYYGVRPGTIGGAASLGGAPSIVASGGNRPPFFPQPAASPDPFGNTLLGTGSLNGEEKERILPPAGHPVVFGNTMGYFPGPAGSGRSTRPALLGVGNNRPAGRK
jgi:hypothetical protein